jgi:8-oxo-dGTP pyrophosphatase MutT (NUDIX family)
MAGDDSVPPRTDDSVPPRTPAPPRTPEYGSDVTARPIRRLREVLVHANRFVRVYDDEVEFPSGSRGSYVRLVPAVAGPGVALLAVCDGLIALVRTYRYPIGDWQWGLPRGLAHDTDPLVTAAAELREELGAEAAGLRVIGSFTPDSGLEDIHVHVVVATVEDRTGRPQDVDEVAAVRWVTVDQLWEMAANGRLDDGMTLAALAIAQAKGALDNLS